MFSGSLWSIRQETPISRPLFVQTRVMPRAGTRANASFLLMFQRERDLRRSASTQMSRRSPAQSDSPYKLLLYVEAVQEKDVIEPGRRVTTAQPNDLVDDGVAFLYFRRHPFDDSLM